ncbi:MAG: hypothetical protein MJZ99_05390 [Bacteroidales bacterium]|nr:hypothetical protein [Bacteroidales bacterium]
MKKIFLIIGSCLFFTAMTCSCDTDDEQHHRISFYNGSAYNVFVAKSYDYPDTSLWHTQNVMTLGWNLEVGAHNYNNEALISRGSYESKFISMDTLIVFVFNSDTLSSRGWDYVKDHNNVTQRYDLSLSNLRNLNWRIAFPPTEEMRNIKMWPPYGTYDSMGFPVR